MSTCPKRSGDSEMAEAQASAKAEALVASGNPVGGLIRPDEVASAALYLASPEARMINGHALSLSGGEI